MPFPRFLVVQLDSRDDDTYLKENYVPHGTTRKNIKIVTVIMCYHITPNVYHSHNDIKKHITMSKHKTHT
jgi:hypothetical protein